MHLDAPSYDALSGASSSSIFPIRKKHPQLSQYNTTTTNSTTLFETLINNWILHSHPVDFKSFYNRQRQTTIDSPFCLLVIFLTRSSHLPTSTSSHSTRFRSCADTSQTLIDLSKLPSTVVSYPLPYRDHQINGTRLKSMSVTIRPVSACLRRTKTTRLSKAVKPPPVFQTHFVIED